MLKRPQKSSMHGPSWPWAPSSLLRERLPSLPQTLLVNLMRIKVKREKKNKNNALPASTPDQTNDRPWFIWAGSSFGLVAGCFMEASKPYCKSLEGKQEGGIGNKKKGDEIQHTLVWFRWNVISSHLEWKAWNPWQPWCEWQIMAYKCSRTSCRPHSVRWGRNSALGEVHFSNETSCR